MKGLIKQQQLEQTSVARHGDQMVATPTLTPLDAKMLQQAYAQLQAGDATAAEAKVEMVLQARPGQSDALHLLALTLTPQGRLSEAKQALESALKVVPRHPHILNSYGNVLADLGEPEAAVAAFEKALKIDASYAEAWTNLGITATTAGRLELATKALEQATLLQPQSARSWNALGLTLQQGGDFDAAITYYRKALAINPQDLRARHNLGTALREVDEAQAALEQFDTAIRNGSTEAETMCCRAHVLAELGQFDAAIRQYQDVLRNSPDHIDAHDTLARLLPQLERQQQALDSYHDALKVQPNSPSLWRSAIRAAIDMKNPAQLLQWAHDARQTLGAHIDFDLAQASAHAMLGDHQAAKAHLLNMLAQHPDHAGLHNILTHSLIALGDPQAAEIHGLRAAELNPDDQSAWAYLTVIWRLLDDPREHWLADYERLVIPIDLATPQGFANQQAFLADLEKVLTGLHNMQAQPAEQSLRGGTQTRGNIFAKKIPEIQALAETIQTGVASAISALPDDENHPFLRRKKTAIAFSGSWSVRLHSAGFHVNHMHPLGWISSAFYAALPPEVGDGEAGALAFGVPDSALGLNLPPRRIEKPKAGRLVIFPSYLWHGTIPFESKMPRLTVAFDALPV